MGKKLLSLLLTLLMVVTILPTMSKTVDAETKEWTDGPITATLDTETGVLTITGSGELNSNPSLQEFSDTITSVIVGEGITSIETNVFANCSSLQSIIIPSSVTSIGGYAFSNCGSLQSITFENDSELTNIGEYAFVKCTSLQSIIIPSSVTNIGERAFEYCESLQSIIISSSVTSIGDSAFAYCYYLENVTFNRGTAPIAFNGSPFEDAEYAIVAYDGNGNKILFNENNNEWLKSGDSLNGISGTFTWKDPVVEYPLWVGGTQVTSANAANITGSETPVATYNAETKTLTLSGASITTGYMPPDQPAGTSFGIYYNNNNSDTLNIVLSGTNEIGGGESSVTTGMNNAGPINISGEGSLIISASSTGITSTVAITISSGTVAVETTDEFGMGIASPSLTINDGKVTVVGGLMAIASPEVKNAIAGTGWTNTAGTEGKADIAINTSEDLSSYKKVQFPAVSQEPVDYLDASGEEQTCSNYTVVNSSNSYVVWNDGWYVVKDDATVNNYVYVNSGTVNLILCDGAKLDVGPLRLTGGNLTIYAQSTGNNMGSLKVEAKDDNDCGIDTYESSLTIVGGNITAIGPAGAISGSVKNAIAGTGWTNTAGTEGKADIAVSESGQSISTNFKKVQFPAVHTHDFEYSVSSDGHSIVATCSAADCDLPENKVTLTISADNAVYNGSAYSGASLSGTTEWTAAGLTTPVIKYEGRGSTSYEESETAPTNAGSYTASITVEGKKATADFEVTKAAGTISYTTESITKSVDDKTPFTNILTNTGDGTVTYASNSDVVTVDSGSGMVTINKGGTATITAAVEDGTNYTYENKTASYTVTVNKKTPTTDDFHYSDPGDNEYDGNPKSKYVDPDEAQGVTGMGEITVKYYSDETCTKEVSPINAGTYYVGITVTEGDNYTASSSVLHDTDWKFTITKTNPNTNNFIYSEPSDLQYNGNAKTATVVSKEGIAGMGTVTVKYYSDETRTTEVSPVNAGTYYVGIEVAEGDNYNATSTVIYDNSWSFTIAKADPTAVAPTGLTATYGQTLTDVTLTNPEGNTQGTWAWTDSSTSVGNAGSNTFKANFTPKDTDNYNSVSGIDVTVTVGQATQTITAQDVTATFGDTGVKVEATTTGDGKISYAVKSGSEDYIGVMIETGELSLIKAGTGTIVVTAAATENYEEANKEVTVTINKADSTPATVNANNRTYDGTEQALITVEGEPTGGTMYYCIGEDEETPTAFDTEIPKATDAKTYYVFYHVKGDDNHKDTEPVCVTVTISPVDKTALNEKINEAEEYYNSIKDNDDYKEVADTLKEAIDNAKDVADNDNQTKTQVEEATTALNNALDKAKKDVEDIDAANEVADMVSKLPNPNDVTTADKDSIEAARKAYDNLTDEQKSKLPVDTKDKLEQVEKALKEAQDQEAADKVADMVSKLPNPNDVTKDDKDAVEAARKAYDNLTPEQKAKLPVDTKDKLEQVEEALLEAIEGIKYSNIVGEGSTWIKGSTTGDTFTFKRNINDHKTFNKFDGILVDGKSVDYSDYIAKSGSVIIELKPSFLETLSVGRHTLTARFKDGNDVTVKFYIIEKKKDNTTPTYIVPKTGVE